MTPYKSTLLTAVPPTLEKRLGVMNAIRSLAAPDQDERLRARGVEIAGIRRDLQQHALTIVELRRACDPRLRSYVLNYGPHRLRAPAGAPHEGRWTIQAKSAVQKANPDDPEHPGWAAGTPRGIGGQFRPKDGEAADSSMNSADGAETRSVMNPSSPTKHSQVAQALPPALLFEEPPLVVRPPLPEFPKDPSFPPGPGFEWRGQPWSEPGDPYGSWYNPKTDETLSPDMDHPPPIPPHWDYQTPDGQWYRWFPDGRLELRS
jgi:hypothetical protein